MGGPARDRAVVRGRRRAPRSPASTPPFYGLPEARLAEAGRLRGLAAEVRDRGATADPDGPMGRGAAYWPEVLRLLRDSYRSLSAAVSAEDPG